MNDEPELRSRMASAATASPADRVDVDAAVVNGARRRRTRRTLQWTAAAVVLASIGSVMWTTGGTDQGDAIDPAGTAPKAESSVPNVLGIDCTPQGLELSAPVVAAQASGVVVRVSPSASPRAAVSYESTGNGGINGGTGLDQLRASSALSLSPGIVTLSCSLDDYATPAFEARAEVVDPQGYWRDDTASESGCTFGAQPLWAVGPSGVWPSAEEAVEDLLQKFSELPGTDENDLLTAKPIPVGYVAAPEQTWLATDQDGPYFTVQVVTGAGGFHAYPDATCGDR